VGNLVNGVGRTAGSALVVRTFDALARSLPPPLNYAVGLAIFQLFFIPTGIMYWLASRSAPRDLADVDRLLRQRAGTPPAPTPPRPAPLTEASSTTEAPLTEAPFREASPS